MSSGDADHPPCGGCGAPENVTCLLPLLACPFSSKFIVQRLYQKNSHFLSYRGNHGTGRGFQTLGRGSRTLWVETFLRMGKGQGSCSVEHMTSFECLPPSSYPEALVGAGGIRGTWGRSRRWGKALSSATSIRITVNQHCPQHLLGASEASEAPDSFQASR